MASPLESRPRFYEGQYLGADDLSAAVAYARAQEARHALGAHTWGIAMGLDFKETPLPGGKVQVSVLPGYAWDGYGRPIVLLSPARLPEELFAAISYDATLDAGGDGRQIGVWIRFDERLRQGPRPGFETCDERGDPRARVSETFRFEISPQGGHPHDGVTVAGVRVDAASALRSFDTAAPLISDESIPHQAFPDASDPQRWLIPLGFVRWRPAATGPGGFAPRKAPDDDLASRRARRYIGVVAETIGAARGTLCLRDRARAPSVHFQPPTTELVWIEGHLRVEGDARLAGGRLDLVDASGSDRGSALQLRRSGDAGKLPGELGGRSLEAAIGPLDQSDNRLTVGPLKVDGTLEPRLVVLSGGNVGIGTASPETKLEIGAGGDLSFRGTLNDPGDIVWKSNTGAEKARVWSKPTAGAGLHLSAGTTTPHLSITDEGKVGINTTSPSNRLHVDHHTGIRQNRLYLSGGDGWSSLAYNAHHDAANGSWIMPDPTRAAMTIELDDSGGPPRFEVYGNVIGDASGWQSRLKVEGGTGNVWLGANGGNLGVGTATPATKLHVNGARLRLESAGKRLDMRTDGSAVDLHSETSKLFLRSTGPGDNNQVLLNPFESDGRVGVGTQTPECKLHVSGTTSGDDGTTAGHVALIENRHSGFGADVLALRIASPIPSTGNNFLTFFAGPVAAGSIEGNILGVTYKSFGADFAEAWPRRDRAEVFQPGDVIGLVAGQVTHETEGAHQVLVVSERPVMVGGLPAQDADAFEIIALVGRVRVRVHGPVAAGSFLVASGRNDGLAVAVPPDELGAAHLGAVVGQALESVTTKGAGRVDALVGGAAQSAALSVVVRQQEAELASARATGKSTRPRKPTSSSKD